MANRKDLEEPEDLAEFRMHSFRIMLHFPITGRSESFDGIVTLPQKFDPLARRYSWIQGATRSTADGTKASGYCGDRRCRERLRTLNGIILAGRVLTCFGFLMLGAR